MTSRQRSLARLAGLVAVASVVNIAATPHAHACGCFAPPDPANPIVQAGERILFAATGTQVTAIIQIQYQGTASDFGWLLPLPSLPSLDVSSDEVFATLAGATAPDYQTTVRWSNTQCWPQAGGGFADSAAAADLGAAGPSDPLVVESSVGPYDYAVLKADDQTALLAWLQNNRYFVPVGTNNVLAPYLHTGAYFLALKLHSGKTAGDLQPIVVRYASDLPMIPITLTSVTASQGMNVWAWILGGARAIPRNYYHAVIDDAALRWPTWFGNAQPSNYADVVQAAVKSTTGHHAFVTELAAPTSQWASHLFPSTKYGDPAVLKNITGAGDYLRYLRQNGYAFSTQLVAILQKYIPMPMNLQDRFGRPASPANYYYNFDFWFSTYPMYFQNFSLAFDAATLTSEIDAKIVKPLRDAGTLFSQFQYLTRLYTRLDPDEMNADPVFSFNPSLPDVSNVHHATLDMTCDTNFQPVGTLVTEQGFPLQVTGWSSEAKASGAVPPALRIETLSEAGPPTVVVDNEAQVRAVVGPTPTDMGVVMDAGAKTDASVGLDAGVADASASDAGTTVEKTMGCSVDGSRSGTFALGWIALASVIAGIALRGRRRRIAP